LTARPAPLVCRAFGRSALALGALLSGCAREPAPAFVTETHPVIPAECDTQRTPPAKEPKIAGLADLPDGASDAVAVRDRMALKRALREEVAKRATCSARLKALFPEAKP